MAEILAILAMLALLAALAAFCHGLFARARMQRYQRPATRHAHPRQTPAAKPE